MKNLAIRKAEGLKIDPDTAEVSWEYGQTLDLYGVCPDLPDEIDRLGEYILPEGREARSGSLLTIFRRNPRWASGTDRIGGTQRAWEEFPS